MNKTIETGAAPSITHGTSDKEFHNFFKEQVKKVGDSQFRVQIVTSPYLTTTDYRNNYDLIKWPNKYSLKKML